MFADPFSTAALVHIAALCHVAGFLLRDQIRLRLLLLLGNLLYALYYILHPETPLWDAAIWSVIMVLSNGVLTMILIRERQPGAMSAEEREIYELLGQPLPGHFRQIMRAAERGEAGAARILIRAGERPSRLFYLHQGPAHVTLPSGNTRVVETGFLGELSLLLNQPASATVELPEGARYLVWDRSDLERLFARAPVIRTSFERLVALDIARKLAADPGMAQVLAEAGRGSAAHPEIAAG